MRRYLAAGIWLALTVTATLIVWTAVSVVGADVTDRPAPVVAHRDVVVALQAGTTLPPATTTTTVPATSTPPRTTRPTLVPPLVLTPTTTIAPPRGPGVAPTTSTTPPAPPTTRSPVKPPAPTTTAPAGGTATYSTEGGVVAVACTGFSSIRLVAALPYDGFQAVALSGGPLFVRVNFVSPTRNISVSAACFFGLPLEQTQG